MIKLINILPILTALSFPIIAHASGIQVSPDRLNFTRTPAAGQNQQLTVANPGGDAAVFEVYAEDYPDLIIASPNSFALEPGGRKTVTVSVNARRLPAGFKTNLDVLGKPLTQNSLAVAAGVKIPLWVQKQNPPAQNFGPLNNLWLFTAMLAFGVLGFTAYIFFSKRAKKSSP